MLLILNRVLYNFSLHHNMLYLIKKLLVIKIKRYIAKYLAM